MTFSLSGSGTHALAANTTALHVTISTLPTLAGVGTANPVNYYQVAMLRFGDGTGYFDAVPVVGGPQWLAVPTGATQLGYHCETGAVLSVAEVIGGTPPFGGSQALAGLSDVALAGLTDTQVLTYAASSAKWINATPSGGGGGGVSDVLLLDWSATTDITGAPISGATWTDTFAAQSFTVLNAARPVEISVSGCMRVGGAATDVSCCSRLVIDGSILRPLGFNRMSAAADRQNALSGGGPAPVTGLSAAAHTVKLQVWVENVGVNDIYCRAASFNPPEFFSIRVWQR